MLLASVVFLVGAALMLTGHVATLFTGRLFTGLGVGPLTAIAPLYLSEIAPAALRGRCIGLFEIMYQFGGLLGFVLSPSDRLDRVLITIDSG